MFLYNNKLNNVYAYAGTTVLIYFNIILNCLLYLWNWTFIAFSNLPMNLRDNKRSVGWTPFFYFIIFILGFHTVHTLLFRIHSHFRYPVFSSLGGSHGKTSLGCRAEIRTLAYLTANRRTAKWAAPHLQYINELDCTLKNSVLRQLTILKDGFELGFLSLMITQHGRWFQELYLYLKGIPQQQRSKSFNACTRENF